GGYNDFNTFYFQAVSGSTGGSSGSPVIDIDGEVIALNAGARNDAASSYFLPLDRVVRALALVEQGKHVSRGTIQAVFQHQYFDELERLGLPADTEASLRKDYPEATGLLVVDQVLPDGPSDLWLQPGDVLLKVDGKVVSSFVPLDEAMDSSVGGDLSLDILRGGKPMTVRLKVQDLDDTSPTSYLEFGGAILNNLSLQVARGYNNPVKGAYVAAPGYMFGTAGIARAAVITEFDGKPVANIDDLQAALAAEPDGAHARFRYFNIANKKQPGLGVVTIDRHWFPAQRCSKDQATGNWPCTALPPAPPAVALQPATADYPKYPDASMNKLAPSLVFVKFDMPYNVDGVGETHYLGTGVVVDAAKGLVVVDRDTVPVSMGDVKLTFAGSLEVPGKVVYVHPLHNLAVIQYDPKLLGKTPIRAVTFAPSAAKPGETVKLVGYQADGGLTSQSSQVASLDPVVFPLSRSLRFRDTNLEVQSLVNAPDNVSGVLLDKQDRVTSFWFSFVYDDGNRSQEAQRGIPADVVQDMLKDVEAGKDLRTLDVEFYPTALSQARKLGLPAEWVQKLSRVTPDKREVLTVSRMTAGAPAAKLLQNGDLLLAIDGKPVASFRQVEKASQPAGVTLTVLRDGEVKDLKIDTVALPSDGTQRLLMWAGAMLQKPSHAASAQRSIPGDGLLVGFYNYGSPASRYGLATGWRIIGVNGVQTPDMDSFLKQVQGLKDRDNVRLAVQSWDGTAQVITLKMDQRYWSPYEVIHTDEGWARKAL
ncbi:MAG TPA: hypothetical protein VGM16_09910, partial [Gammaproteobacteria bacterium]